MLTKFRVNQLFWLLISLFIINGTVQSSATFKEQALVSFQSISFNSLELDDSREIQIYLPESYQFGSKKYPVIYVLDSDFLFHQVISIVSVRSSRDLMPESIIVGISNPNNQQRFLLGMPMKREKQGRTSFKDGNPGKFLLFLEKELFIFIDNQFRAANHRSIIGMSPTAGVVMSSYLNRSGLFDAHIAIASDPHFFDLDGIMLADKFIKSTQTHTKKRRWLYLSRGELDTPQNPNILTIFDHMQKTFSKNSGKNMAKAEIIKDGEHYESSLLSIIHAFQFIYPVDVWRPNYRALRKVDKPELELAKFYKQLSSLYGFETYPTVSGYWMGNSITGLSRYMVRQNKPAKAISLLKWGMGLFPEAIALHHGLSTTYENMKQNKRALKFATSAYKLAKMQKDPDLDYYENRVKSIKTN